MTASPRQVLLFSGHRMDEPGRATPRFPAAAEPAAARAIADALQALAAGPADLALAQAAAGGDLLFLEACVARGVPRRILLPFPLPAFIERSVLPSVHGAAWRDRLEAVLAAPGSEVRVMADPGEADPYQRCNTWLLETALAYGAERLRAIALWNGATGDGPGGTSHLVHAVRRHGGQLRWLDTRELFHGPDGPGSLNQS